MNEDQNAESATTSEDGESTNRNENEKKNSETFLYQSIAFLVVLLAIVGPYLWYRDVAYGLSRNVADEWSRDGTYSWSRDTVYDIAEHDLQWPPLPHVNSTGIHMKHIVPNLEYQAACLRRISNDLDQMSGSKVPWVKAKLDDIKREAAGCWNTFETDFLAPILVIQRKSHELNMTIALEIDSAIQSSSPDQTSIYTAQHLRQIYHRLYVQARKGIKRNVANIGECIGGIDEVVKDNQRRRARVREIIRLFPPDAGESRLTPMLTSEQLKHVAKIGFAIGVDDQAKLEKLFRRSQQQLADYKQQHVELLQTMEGDLDAFDSFLSGRGPIDPTNLAQVFLVLAEHIADLVIPIDRTVTESECLGHDPDPKYKTR